MTWPKDRSGHICSLVFYSTHLDFRGWIISSPRCFCIFAPAKAWKRRPGTGKSSVVSHTSMPVDFGRQWQSIKQWSHHQKGQGNDKLLMSKHGALDEHSNIKTVSKRWAYHNIRGNFQSVVLVRKTCPIQDHFHITCTTSTLASCLRARNAGHWQHVIFGNTSPVICFAFHVCRFAMVNSTYFNFRAKGAFECILLYEQRCASQHNGVQRVWIKLGSSQTWAALDANSWNHIYS